MQKAATKQPGSNVTSLNGSRFQILTDPISNEANVDPHAFDAITNDTPPEVGKAQATSTLKENPKKDKGKGKAKDFVTAASKESLFEDTRPLNKEPIVPKKVFIGQSQGEGSDWASNGS